MYSIYPYFSYAQESFVSYVFYMVNNKRVNDTYTNKARKEGYLARSIYKLEELDKKYHFFDEDTHAVLDIGCAPWSWLQYVDKTLSWKGKDDRVIIWCDIKKTLFSAAHVYAYQQDITDREWVKQIMQEHEIGQFDVIISDMAPDTIGTSDIDALRSIGLIEKTLRIYETYLKPEGKFAIKVFMWPGFDELMRDLKQMYGAGNICTFKPRSCRKSSKETYIVKRG